jgi:hypothetical protein
MSRGAKQVTDDVPIPPDYMAKLVEMAAESGLSPGQLVASLVMAILEDDARAHEKSANLH